MFFITQEPLTWMQVVDHAIFGAVCVGMLWAFFWMLVRLR
jgi:hypothetical protein